MRRARVRNRLLAIETNRATRAFTIVAIHLINAHSTLTCGISLQGALVNVNVASLAAEAFFAHTFEQIVAVDETLAVVETIASWTFRRVVAFGNTMKQMLVEIGAHGALHRMVDVLVQANEKTMSVPGVFELLNFGASQILFRARIFEHFVARRASPWFHAIANERFAFDFLARAAVHARVVGTHGASHVTIGPSSIGRTYAVEAAVRSSLANSISRTWIERTRRRGRLASFARKTPRAFAFKSFEQRIHTCGAVQTRTIRTTKPIAI